MASIQRMVRACVLKPILGPVQKTQSVLYLHAVRCACVDGGLATGLIVTQLRLQQLCSAAQQLSVNSNRTSEKLNIHPENRMQAQEAHHLA